MRTIKFRGKRVDNGEWVYGWYLIGDLLTDYHAIVNFEYRKDHIYRNEYSVLKSTVGQFTGLCDKNGKEIYEGDVVWCRAGEHRSGVWEYEKRFIVEYRWSQSMWEMSMCHEIEVIGNIHDKKENK